MKQTGRTILSILYWIALSFCMAFPALVFADLRDPTLPEGDIIETTVTFELNAIYAGKDRQVAVINGRIYHVGDFFSNVQVSSIDDSKVVLMGPDGKITLTLLRSPIKTPK